MEEERGPSGIGRSVGSEDGACDLIVFLYFQPGSARDKGEAG